MTQDIILSGFGGQGILTAGLVISESAILEGLNATFFPSYGAEMRGGTANCHVRISDSEIGSPVLSSALFLIAMSEPAIKKFLPRVREEGTVFYNSDFTDESMNVNNCRILTIKSEKMAMEKFGSAKASNMIMTGAFIGLSGLIKLLNAETAVRERFALKGDEIVDVNIEAIHLGFDAVQESK
jgi:2-oxoglutarate ferredoxin oxidoreductase subunit gamma